MSLIREAFVSSSLGSINLEDWQSINDDCSKCLWGCIGLQRLQAPLGPILRHHSITNVVILIEHSATETGDLLFAVFSSLVRRLSRHQLLRMLTLNTPLLTFFLLLPLVL
jgi:hypothetical protein